MSQPTASKTDLLFECLRPFDPATPRDHEVPGEPARFGSAWHECLHSLIFAARTDFISIAARWGLASEELVQELQKHTTEALHALNWWTTGNNPWGEPLQILEGEIPLATRVKFLKGGRLKIKSRRTSFDAESHTYQLDENEFGGTADLVLRNPKNTRRIVLDFKSGAYGEFHKPLEINQMLTLAGQTNADTVAILHYPRGGIPCIYADDVPADLLAAHMLKLRKRLRLIGDGTMRPGKWCDRCPARSSCPSKDAELLKAGGQMMRAMVVASTSQESAMAAPGPDKGTVHMFLAEYNKLAARMRDALKADVIAGEIVVRPDGKVLVIKQKTVESLSKSSVIRALGPAAGEKMLAKLRKLGCITEDTREELWAVNE